MPTGMVWPVSSDKWKAPFNRERNTLFALTLVHIYQSLELILHLTAHSKRAKKEILNSHANNVSIFDNPENTFADVYYFSSDII